MHYYIKSIFFCNNKHKCLFSGVISRNVCTFHIFKTFFIFTWNFLPHLPIFGFSVHSTRTTQSDKSL